MKQGAYGRERINKILESDMKRREEEFKKLMGINRRLDRIARENQERMNRFEQRKNEISRRSPMKNAPTQQKKAPIREKSKLVIPNLDILQPIIDNSGQYEQALKGSIFRNIGSSESDRSAINPITKAKIHYRELSPDDFVNNALSEPTPSYPSTKSNINIHKNKDLERIHRRELILRNNLKALDKKENLAKKKIRALSDNTKADIDRSFQKINKIIHHMKKKI